MKAAFSLTLILLFSRMVSLTSDSAERSAGTNTQRLRVIMTSDFPRFPVTNSDPDDVQSMVRFLLYANEFDVEGLIASAGTFGMVAEKRNILAVLDEYDQVDENLRKHDPKYPTADALRAVTFEGKGNNNGIRIQWGCGKQSPNDIIGKGKDSEASKAIIAAAATADLHRRLGRSTRSRPGDLGCEEHPQRTRVESLPRQAARFSHCLPGRHA